MREGNTDGNIKHELVIPYEPGAANPHQQTAKAFGVFCNGVMIWFPLSQISELQVGEDQVSFLCPRWLIEAKSVEIFISE